MIDPIVDLKRARKPFEISLIFSDGEETCANIILPKAVVAECSTGSKCKFSLCEICAAALSPKYWDELARKNKNVEYDAEHNVLTITFVTISDSGVAKKSHDHRFGLEADKKTDEPDDLLELIVSAAVVEAKG